ncbi:uncharacterized protein LOC129790476 isoform X2 [Lutzomyia longipalpis]|uniref:uncharacterized protein LOC129790476 isoform X2 n=1 Tax=Lutzomyia longipalpis TaxID=7200 RepID=UPI00248375AD|nr:uncharacterized protein LOC129790476 isoform X2 [Lutzomyia longipalpis]XP_055683947.1 uncharacterized protein LOC129790476 isoform X2 [Lutzomyia longipalpis]
MENAEEEMSVKYTFIEDSANVIEIGDEDAAGGEEMPQMLDFNESAISKLLDAVEKLNRILETQRRVAEELNLTQEEENENVLEGTVTFPLKSLKEFQSLERMSTNESYRKNLTKSLRLLLIKGAIQDPIKNLLDDSIVMHFSWDEPNKPCIISLRHTICFGHVIYNALGMGFTDYANFVHTCLTLAQARSQNSDVCTLNTIRAESQFQHFAYVVSDISQRISDIEIFQKKIEAYTCLRKHEVDPKIYFPIASIDSLTKLEEILQYRIVQEVVISYCKDLYKKDKSLKSIVLDDFLANYSLNGECKKSDLFRFTFFNHTLCAALEMRRVDYEVEVAHQIDCAAERTFGKGSSTASHEASDEAAERVNKILTHRKVVMIRKEDLAEQGIPRKLREILWNGQAEGKAKATFFTDAGNFVSLTKVAADAERGASSDEDLEEKVAKYFPLRSLKDLRSINIKLQDDHFRFSLQQILDEFYHNRKFSIKDILTEDFLVNVDERDLFSGCLMKDFLPVILSLPPRSFIRMVKMEFRALKSALELRRANYSELLQLRIEMGRTVELPKSPNGSFRAFFPLTTIQAFDELERSLEYEDFFRQISNACRIVLMREKKFKLTHFIGDEILGKFSARGSPTTLSLMDTRLFGEILREFSKLEEPEFAAILHKHHNNAVAKRKGAQMHLPEGDSHPDGKKRRRQFVEVVFPLANKTQLLLVDENLKDEGFRNEIERILGDLLHRQGEVVQEIPLENILEVDLIGISSWDDNEETSLKVYCLFRDVIFKLTSVAWPSYDEMMRKAFKRLSKAQKSPAQENSRSYKSLNDFVIIPPPKKMVKSDNTVKSLPEEAPGVHPRNSQTTQAPQETQNAQNSSEMVKRAKDNNDGTAVVCESEDDAANRNGFDQILPIKSKEEFLLMESMLTDNNFATYFSLLCSNCDDKTALLRDIINEDALRYFTWHGTADTLRFQGTMLCSILSARAYGSNMSVLKGIIDSVQEKAAAQDVAGLFPIANKDDLKTVESYVPHIKTKMVQHFTELRQKSGNGVFSQMFSPSWINSLNQSELENFAKTPFYRDVIQVVFKDIKRFHILEAIRDEFETPEGFFKRILPVNEINLALFELKLQRKPFVDCLISICSNWMKSHSDGYFHKLIDSDLIQQYSFNGDDGLRAIEKSILFNTVLREIYKKSDMELHTKVQMELYLAQALADYKSDKLQS